MKALKHLGPLVAYTTYIFIAGSVKNGAAPMEMSDKVAHCLAFGFMVLPALLAVSYLWPRLAFASRVVVAAVTASAIGALLEAWQSFLPWRSCDVLDWAADTVGATAVMVAVIAARSVVPANTQRDQQL